MLVFGHWFVCFRYCWFFDLVLYLMVVCGLVLASLFVAVFSFDCLFGGG